MRRLVSIIAFSFLATFALADQPTPAPDPISSPAVILREAAGEIKAVADTIDKEPPKPSDDDWTERPPVEVVAGKLARFELKAKPAGVVQWFAFARGVKILDPALRSDNPHIAYVETDEPGEFIVVATWDGGKAVSEFKVVGVGPQPVPPEPGPTPPPVPVPPVGQRRVVVLYESAEKTPALALLLTDLRVGAFETYRREKKHTLEILDDELLGDDWKAVLGGLPLPALIVCDAVTDTVIAKQPLPPTGEAIIEAVKGAGG